MAMDMELRERISSGDGSSDGLEAGGGRHFGLRLLRFRSKAGPMLLVLPLIRQLSLSLSSVSARNANRRRTC